MKIHKQEYSQQLIYQWFRLFLSLIQSDAVQISLN